MKKIISLSQIFLILFICISMVGCGNESVPDSSGGTDTGKKEDVVLCDFESWAPEFNNILIFNDFGRVSLNRDKKYITNGEGSARLDPLGGKNASTYPYVMFSTTSAEYDYSDFSYSDYIEFDIYNDNNEDKTIYAGIINEITNITTASRISEKSITLKPGWNNCKYQVERDLLLLFESLKNVKGFYLRFDPAYSADIVEGENQTPRYYIDNIKIKNSPFKTDENLKMELDENEIANFERLYQQFMFTSDYNSTFKIINASADNLKAVSGNKILKTNLAGNGVSNGNWNNFMISPKLINASVMPKLGDRAKKAYFCFEIYNPGEKRINMSVLYRSSANAVIADTSLDNKPGEWVTYEYSIGDLLKSDPNYLTKIGPIRIFYKANFEGQKTMYFDNFRIEIRD